jgi:hypothetical protein
MQELVDDGFASVNIGSNPAFGLSEGKTLRPADRFISVSGRRHLVSRVARDHWDLRAHVQRIYLMLHAGDPEEMIFGALVDLFLALGDKGHELRQKLLKLARPALHDDDFYFLDQRLVNGLQRMDVLPITMGSILDRAVFGSCHLVERQRSVTTLENSAVDVAAMHLENGDINSACAVLEAALLDDPANVAVEAELLEIYRRSRDDARFRAMRRRLETVGVSPGAEWDEL